MRHAVCLLPTLNFVYLSRPPLCLLAAAARAWLAWNEHIEQYADDAFRIEDMVEPNDADKTVKQFCTRVRVSILFIVFQYHFDISLFRGRHRFHLMEQPCRRLARKGSICSFLFLFEAYLSHKVNRISIM